MSEWTTATLGEIAKIITGPYGSQLHQSDYVEDGYPLIMPQNIGDRTLDYSKIAYISEKDAKRLSRYATKPNDIVYSRRGNIEKHAFITELGTYCGTGCFLVRFKTNDIEPLFMSFYLNLPKSKEWLKQNSVGSNMMNLNTDILKAIPISYPNKKTQLAIARFLNNIDRKIALNKAISAELDSTARMLYDYWFTQFDFPDENGKPYRASGGVMVWSEELKREIPKDWNVKPIKQCIVKISTGLNPRQNFILGRGSNRYVTIKNIENGHLDLNKCDFVDDEALIRIHARSDIKVGDILFTSIEPIGRLYLINETPEDWDINESVFSIRTNESVVSREYLYSTLDSDLFRSQISPLKTGSVQKGIRIGALESIKIIIPDAETMLKFTVIITPIHRAHGLREKEKNDLIALRDFLLPLLMNGQVSVGTGAVTEKTPTKQQSVFKRLVLSAYILDNICDEPTAGRVKFEKLLYLSEYCAEIDLHSDFHRHAAGPYDPKALHSIEEQLKKNKWFGRNTDKTQSRAYVRLGRSDGYKPYVETNLQAKQKNVIDRLIRLFKTTRTIQCEIVATLFGAWNDFLIEGVQPTDDQIVNEVLTNWHERKERIDRKRWLNALGWMRQNDIIPVGYGTSTKGC